MRCLASPASPGPGSALFLLGALAACAVLPACGGDVTAATGGAGGTPSTTSEPVTGGAGGAPAGGTGGASTTTTIEPAGGTGGATTGGGGTGGMAPDPWAGPVESLAELDLGPIDFGVQESFPIPDKTLGFTVQVVGQNANAVVGIYRLRPPVGSSVIFNFAMSGHDTQVFGGIEQISGADPQADSADAYPVKPGDWKLTLGSDGNSGASAGVRVWVRRTSDGAFHGGVVDVNLFIVPGVATQSYMNQVLDAFFPYAGLDVGKVSVFSADSAFTTVNSRDEFRAMLQTSSAAGDAPAINLFVVDNFSNSEFGGAIGVAGGIPASPQRHGTVQSGLAYEPSGDPGYDATVLMHEIGHMGGLFHTTEFQITETDPLSDTAACDSGVIQNNPDQCPDVTNVMFPIAAGATTFSAAQLNVLHGSALYRGILEAGGVPSPPLLVPFAGKIVASPFLDGDLADAGVRAMPRSPDALQRALGALWCSGGFADRTLAIARAPGAAAAPAIARLRTIALDPGAPVLLRKRALGLLVRAAKEAGVLPEALETALALSGALSGPTVADRRLALAALRIVRDARGSAAPVLAKRIDSVLALARSSKSPLVLAVVAGE